MSVSATETEALICAFRLKPWQALGTEALALEPTTEAPLWLHLNLLDNRARRYVEHCPTLHEDGRALLLANDARIQAQVFDGGFAAILGDLHYDFDTDPESFGLLWIYVDARSIVTCRRHRVRSVDKSRRVFEQSGADFTPFDLFVRLALEIATGFADVASELGDVLETAEDRVLAGRWRDQASELGRIRRVLARLRRHKNADRATLASLVQRVSSVFDEAVRAELREVVERLDATAQDMDLLTERARLLQEEIASRLGEATNRNLYLLSIVTTALLPVTLITGIFGMNVGGLPLTESPSGFFWVMLGMTAIVVGTMVLLRRSRVL
jgi:zinc transporter